MSSIARRFYAGSGRVIPKDFLGFHTNHWPTSNTFTFTANAGTDRLAVAHSGRGNYTWRRQVLATTGVLPRPLKPGGDYWNLPVDAANVMVSDSEGGAPIDILDAGSGTHSITFLSRAPDFRFGHARSWDGVRWADAHTADDTYDTTRIDTWMLGHMLAGRSVMWCVAGTPTWASSSPGSAGTYNNGDAHPPINISSSGGPLKEFLTFLITRYNKAAGGVFATDAQRIKWVEVWNEPGFSGTGFWKGTASELAQIAKAAKEAVHAVDPAVKIIGPGFGAGATLGNPTLSTSVVKQFYEASDGAGGVGADHVTGFSWHPYGRGFGGSDSDVVAQDAWSRKIAETYNLSTRHANEWGDFPGATASPRFDDEALAILEATLLLQAGLGWTTSTMYSYDHVIAFSAPVVWPALRRVCDDIYDRVCGKTLAEGVTLTDRRVHLEFSDGTSYTSRKRGRD